jgi:Zn-dependent M28 family amino/carboxypeptidase
MTPRSVPVRTGLAAAAAALVAAAAWGDPVMPPPAPPGAAVRRVDRAPLMAAVRTLASAGFQGRRTGTPGAAAARRYLVRQFEEAGVEPAFGRGYLQPFQAGRAAEGVNVAGLVRGTESALGTIVVSAHYDHLGVRNGRLYPGADDNASGVAVLLAGARYFAAERPRHTMVFAAFDAEELMLAGAAAFMRAPPIPRDRLAFNLNLDMLSRSERREIVAAGAFHAPWLLPILQDIQRRSSVRIVPGRDRPGGAPRGDWTGLSDHAVFHEAGVPFLYFGVEDHADYHRPGDTADRIDPAFLGDVADMVLEALVVLDRELAARAAGASGGREPFPRPTLRTGA